MRSDEGPSLVKDSVETADKDFGLCTTRKRNCRNRLVGWCDLVVLTWFVVRGRRPSLSSTKMCFSDDL